MKRILLFAVPLAVVVAAVFLGAGWSRSRSRHAAELARQRAEWMEQKAELEAALELARAAGQVAAAPAAAREMLGRPLLGSSGSALDLNDRDHLFSVLAKFGDTRTHFACLLAGTNSGIDRILNFKQI